ncbi:MAG: M4 family metallopeptidase [Lachnospiraceae bacterium]|nr:M4 family metallopeptidase [Lachnospiraceae bacterium]
MYGLNINKDKDDQAYTAHYVTAEGEYMYSIPVAEPGDSESVGGQSAKSSFDFDAYEPDELKVTVELKSGKQEVSVPVLKDSKTGKTYLADAKRKILCAEQYPFFYNDYEIVLAEGKPELNACYVTKLQGFQVFAWTRAANFGGCIDVVGHEYTHCVTTRTMTYNLYMNDPGAINEGYSDIMDNLIEMQMEGEDEEGAWLIAEDAGKPFLMLIRITVCRPGLHRTQQLLKQVFLWEITMFLPGFRTNPERSKGSQSLERMDGW